MKINLWLLWEFLLKPSEWDPDQKTQIRGIAPIGRGVAATIGAGEGAPQKKAERSWALLPTLASKSLWNGANQEAGGVTRQYRERCDIFHHIPPQTQSEPAPALVEITAVSVNPCGICNHMFTPIWWFICGKIHVSPSSGAVNYPVNYAVFLCQEDIVEKEPSPRRQYTVSAKEVQLGKPAAPSGLPQLTLP